jgi:hypothetical protein
MPAVLPSGWEQAMDGFLGIVPVVGTTFTAALVAVITHYSLLTTHHSPSGLQNGFFRAVPSRSAA